MPRKGCSSSFTQNIRRNGNFSLLLLPFLHRGATNEDIINRLHTGDIINLSGRERFEPNRIVTTDQGRSTTLMWSSSPLDFLSITRCFPMKRTRPNFQHRNGRNQNIGAISLSLDYTKPCSRPNSRIHSPSSDLVEVSHR